MPAKAERQSGSPEGEPEYLVIGRLRRPHGVRGEILMEVLTDFPERLHSGMVVLVGEKLEKKKFRSIRGHNQGLIVAFNGISDREQAGELRNQLVFVLTADRPALPEGEYYHHQLIGLTVTTDEGQILGKLVEIMVTGANDVYVVSLEDGRDVLLPAIESVVLNIDLEQKTMQVHLLPGLLSD